MHDHSTLKRIFEAAVGAVAPDRALRRHVAISGNTLTADGRGYDLSRVERVFVLGAGKGAAPMAAALEDLLGKRIHAGLVVVKYDHGLPLKHIRLAEAAHPVPDEAGVEAAREILNMAQSATERDLVICLFTGGASALTPAPAPGVSLDDLQRTTQSLLKCGADITELNAMRKHLSLFGGGQLARAASPAPVLALIVSDVVGDPLDVIASGPTAPDPSTFADCRKIVEKYGLAEKLPESVAARLEDGLAGRVPETPKPGDPLFAQVQNVLAANNRQALEAAAQAAIGLGFEARILTDSLTGEARVRALDLVKAARDCAGAMRPGQSPVCLLAGGETTVTVRGAGTGGRNQEMALAAALALEDRGGKKNDNTIAMLFAGTDGSDGPTDAAGGFATSETAARARAAGLDPVARLADNDSYMCLKACNDLLITGPTRTNVMDLAVLLVTAPEGDMPARRS